MKAPRLIGRGALLFQCLMLLPTLHVKPLAASHERLAFALFHMIAGAQALVAVAAMAAIARRHLDALQAAFSVLAVMLAAGHIAMNALVVLRERHFTHLLRFFSTHSMPSQARVHAAALDEELPFMIY